MMTHSANAMPTKEKNTQTTLQMGSVSGINPNFLIESKMWQIQIGYVNHILSCKTLITSPWQ